MKISVVERIPLQDLMTRHYEHCVGFWALDILEGRMSPDELVGVFVYGYEFGFTSTIPLDRTIVYRTMPFSFISSAAVAVHLVTTTITALSNPKYLRNIETNIVSDDPDLNRWEHLCVMGNVRLVQV